MNHELALAHRTWRLMLVGAASGWICSSAAAQTTIFEQPLSPRIANYDIKVTLDDKEKRVGGEVVLTWSNPSDDRIDDLQFHLYANAFKNPKSTFMREVIHVEGRGHTDDDPIEVPWEEDNGWGGIKITQMTVDGEDVTGRIAFHHPDDDNTDDETVIRVPLDRPIAPRASTRITIDFEAKIPQAQARTGWWHDDFLMMVHWFPKIGVYEAPGTRFVPADAPHGQWNCHQFHSGTEFYADFGVYDVQITLPEKYVVGTSGLIVDTVSHDDGTKTVIARAEDVHEFAWVADAQFREAVDEWISAATQRQIGIRLLYQPGHESVVSKYIESVKHTLDHVERWLGPDAYPYPKITVVDPRTGSNAGGMEYPMLITGGAEWWAEQLFGDGMRIVEGVTVHEFLHQLWFGIVANNEFEEAWLDEGLTVYSTSRIMDELFGKETSVLDWWGATAGDVGVSRAGLAIDPRRDDGAIADPTFALWHRGVGFRLSYDKTSLVLATLDNYLGRARFDRVMKTYFDRWKFRHPCGNDFIAVANEVAGENLDWFFDQVIKQPTSLDYGVASISNAPAASYEEGILGDELVLPEKSENEDEEEEGEEALYHATVVFRRVGEVIFPMETLIEFSDGRIERGTWDGRDRVQVVRFVGPAKVVRAVIDPDHKVPLDVDPINNSLRFEENEKLVNKYSLKGLFWMQSLLQLFGILG